MIDKPPDSAQPPDQPDEDVSEEALLQKIVEYKNVAVRATADYRNLQRESEEKLHSMRKFANDQLLLELFPLVDYFDSALAAIPDEHTQQGWVQGIKHIQDYLMTILKNHEVERMHTLGQQFNPNVHEAVAEEASEQPDQTIIKELQAGFAMHGKVIRPAKVIIAKNRIMNKE